MKLLKALSPFFFTLFFAFTANAEKIKLLELPSGTGGWHTYSVEAPHKCSFAGVKEIILPDFNEGAQNNLLLDKINFFQRKLNLELNKEKITNSNIEFEIKGARNITFLFSFNPKDCSIVREIELNNQKYNADKIEVFYTNYLKSPVIEKLVIKNGGDDIVLYPWALRGQMSSYEFNFGPAFSIHSNIRRDNQINFQTTDPVIEPIPAIFFRYGPFFLNQDGLGSLVFNWNDISILALVIAEGEPYKTSGINPRKRGLFAGSMIKYDMLQVLYYKDFFKNRGTNLKATLAPEYFPGLAWRISPQLSVQYWNSKYVNYYYGITPQEQLSSDFPQYETGSTVNYAAMLETLHYVDKWTFVVAVGAKFYGPEVYHSPTVVRKNELRFITSIFYKIF